jgi:hypothetical protein
MSSVRPGQVTAPDLFSMYEVSIHDTRIVCFVLKTVGYIYDTRIFLSLIKGCILYLYNTEDHILQCVALSSDAEYPFNLLTH